MSKLTDQMWEEYTNGHRKPYEGSVMDGRMLLKDGMEHGIEPPEELEPDVLLAGKLHLIYGPAESGKSWLALWFVKRCLDRGQRVLYFDAENGRRIVSERLVALGVSTERIDELLHYYPFPHLDASSETALDYIALLEDVEPDVAIYDSLAKFLSTSGLEENSNDDFMKFAAAFLAPARERGVACVVLDHVPHEGDHPRGASRKRDESDVMWSARCSIPFDRDTVGRIVLRRDKDREAWLPESVGFSIGGTDDGFLLKRSDGTVEEADPESGLTDSARRTLEALRDFGERGATAAEWRKNAAVRKVSTPSFWRAKRTITPPEKEGLVIVDSDSSASAVFRAVLSPPGDSDDSEESRVDKPNGETGNDSLSQLSKHYH